MTETAAVETPVAEPVKAWEPTDAVSKAIVADLNEKATEHNTLRAKVDAATGDNSDLIQDLRTNSTNPEVRTAMDKYDAAILKAEKILSDADALIKADLAASADMSEEDIAKAEIQVKALLDDVKAGVNYLARKYGDEVKTALIPLKGAKASKSGSGGGSAKPRLKAVYVDNVLQSATVDVTQTVKGVVSKTGEQRVVSTFTLASKSIPGSTVESLTKAYLDAAKVSTWQDAAAIVEFSVTDKDGKNHMVKACK